MNLPVRINEIAYWNFKIEYVGGNQNSLFQSK